MKLQEILVDFLNYFLFSSDEWKNKWSHIPCEKVKQKTDTANSENPRLNLKLAEIRAGIMRLTDVARRRQLLSHLDQLIKRRPWEKVTGEM